MPYGATRPQWVDSFKQISWAYSQANEYKNRCFFFFFYNSSRIYQWTILLYVAPLVTLLFITTYTPRFTPTIRCRKCVTLWGPEKTTLWNPCNHTSRYISSWLSHPLIHLTGIWFVKHRDPHWCLNNWRKCMQETHETWFVLYLPPPFHGLICHKSDWVKEIALPITSNKPFSRPIRI